MSKRAVVAKRFKRGDRLYVQAQQVWLILVAFVMNGKGTGMNTITYGEVAMAMGHPDAKAGHTIGRQLGIVGNYCVANDLPPLNVIVVDKITGTPGAGVITRHKRSVKAEQRAVFAEDWFGLRVPTTGTFRRVWESM